MYNEYVFEERNPYKDQEGATSADFLDEGRRLLREGDLGAAVLMFEAAVQADDRSEEAWLELGRAQAENENESSAIPALKKAVELAPSLLEGHFALATAYTNENMYNDAARTLIQWLSTHPTYSAAVPPELTNSKPRITMFIDAEFFKEVEDCFLRAAASQEGGIDPDLQNALGVLYNMSGNYDRAVDAMQAAIRVNPADSRLWNRLGATLANSNRSGDAVYAYKRALERYPAYVRARFNLGIACLNLHSYSEAVSHLVSALQLQRRGRSSSPKGDEIGDSVWGTLRVAVQSLCSNDSAFDRNYLQSFLDAYDLDGLSEALEKVNPNETDPTGSAQ